jgi:hypothetical protein
MAVTKPWVDIVGGTPLDDVDPVEAKSARLGAVSRRPEA